MNWVIKCYCGRCISLMGKPLPSTLTPPQQAHIPDVACKMHIAHHLLCTPKKKNSKKKQQHHISSARVISQMNKRTRKYLTFLIKSKCNIFGRGLRLKNDALGWKTKRRKKKHFFVRSNIEEFCFLLHCLELKEEEEKSNKIKQQVTLYLSQRAIDSQCVHSHGQWSIFYLRLVFFSFYKQNKNFKKKTL